MQVSVFQLWYGGKPLDERGKRMTSSVRGFIQIDTKDGHRFASLVDMKRAQEVEGSPACEHFYVAAVGGEARNQEVSKSALATHPGDDW